MQEQTDEVHPLDVESRPTRSSPAWERIRNQGQYTEYATGYDPSTFIDRNYLNAEAPLSTGIEGLDKLLGGGLRNGSNVLGGASAVGKSILALQIAASAAQRGIPTVYFTAEMPAASCVLRVMSLRSTLGPRSGRFSYGGWWRRRDDLNKRLAEVGTDGGEVCERRRNAILGSDPIISAHKSYERDMGSLAIYETREVDEVYRVVCDLRNAEIAPFVVVDYLQKLRAPADMERATTVEQVAATSDTLTRIGRVAHIPVLIISSLNREWTRGKGDEDMSLIDSFKNSGDIGYDAETAVVLMPHYGKDKKRIVCDTNGCKLRGVQIGIAKLRDGEFHDRDRTDVWIDGAHNRLLFDSDEA